MYHVCRECLEHSGNRALLDTSQVLSTLFPRIPPPEEQQSFTSWIAVVVLCVVQTTNVDEMSLNVIAMFAQKAKFTIARFSKPVLRFARPKLYTCVLVLE